MRNRLVHVLTLATQNCVVRTPGFLAMTLEGFSALRFVPPVPKVSAEIKTTIFYMAFLPPRSVIRAFTQYAI